MEMMSLGFYIRSAFLATYYFLMKDASPNALPWYLPKTS